MAKREGLARTDKAEHATGHEGLNIDPAFLRTIRQYLEAAKADDLTITKTLYWLFRERASKGRWTIRRHTPSFGVIGKRVGIQAML